MRLHTRVSLAHVMGDALYKVCVVYLLRKCSSVLGVFSSDYIDPMFMFEHILYDEVNRRNC